MGSVIHYCNKCGERMLLKSGRHGGFYGCTGFPICRSTLSLELAYSREVFELQKERFDAKVKAKEDNEISEAAQAIAKIRKHA